MSTAEKKKITLSLRTETGWITKDLETQSQAESSGAELIKSKKPPRVQKKKSAKKSNDWNIDKDDRFDLPILKNYHDDKLELPLKPGFRKPQPKVKRENNNQKDDKKINAILSHSIDTTVSTTSFESNTMISTSSLDSTRNEIFNAALNLDDNNPSFTFYSNRLNSQLVRTLVNDLKFVKMTSVQAKTIDPLLSNYDMHVQAKTGTGKTVSFLVPAIQKIIDKYRNGRRGISLLVISPTRELAMQIATEAKQIAASFTNIKVGISIGGTNLNTEKNIILSGLDILVATPGRLLDHLSDDNIAGLLYYLDTFVLDECDRLLDMGFSPDIYKIMKFLPIEKQSILCSATVTPRVKDIAVKLLKKDHHFVSTVPIGDVDTHKKVPQFCIEAPFTEQLLQCITVLQNETNEKFKAIVFLPTAHLANLYYCVYSESYPSNVFVQHSRQSQSKRQNVSDKFKDCTFGIMFATVLLHLE
jgi:ATP-dependent RNA helicase MSS116